MIHEDESVSIEELIYGWEKTIKQMRLQKYRILMVQTFADFFDNNAKIQQFG